MTDAVTISVVTGIGAVIMATVSAYFSYKSRDTAEKTHLLVNSRLDEFMEMAKKFYRNEGIMQERSDNLIASRKPKLKKGKHEPERHNP